MRTDYSINSTHQTNYDINTNLSNNKQKIQIKNTLENNQDK